MEYYCIPLLNVAYSLENIVLTLTMVQDEDC